MHLAPGYDPAKAHQYYETHKHLKGRHPHAEGAITQLQGRPQVQQPKDHQHPTAPKPKMSAEQHRQHVQAQVDHLTARLAKLKLVLEKLTNEARARSGVTKALPSAKKTVTKKAPSKPATAAQKTAAKKAAKKSAEKKAQSPQGQAAALEAQIKSVQDQIRQMKATIAAAHKKAAAAKQSSPSSAQSKPQPHQQTAFDQHQTLPSVQPGRR